MGQRLFHTLVVVGAGLALGCGPEARRESKPPDGETAPPPSDDSDGEDSDLPSDESDGDIASCECSGEAFACTGNGVPCCWAVDACCEPCCPDLA